MYQLLKGLKVVCDNAYSLFPSNVGESKHHWHHLTH
jgi:hypothetical protein